MKNFQELIEHRLVSENLQHIMPLLENLSSEWLDHVKKTGEIRKKENTVLEYPDFYHVMVFNKIQALTGEIERLENTLVFMQKFPSPRTYERKGITQYVWLEHHYSAFVVTYHSIYDTALILTNVVFQLGIPEKECKSSTIKNNEWIRKTPIYEALNSLEKTISNYGLKRHLFVHRGEVPDILSINESDVLDMLKLYVSAQQFSEPIVPIEIIDTVFIFESQKIVAELRNDVEIAKEAISKLFDALSTIYFQKSKKISLELHDP